MMKSFLGILVLIFIVFFNKIQASGPTEKIITGKKSPEEDRYRTGLLATSELHTPSSLEYVATSVAQKPPNSDGHHQQSLKELDLVSKLGTSNRYPPQIATSPEMIQNNQIQRRRKEYRPEHSQENIKWLIEQCRRGTLPEIPPIFNAYQQDFHNQDTSGQVHVSSVRGRENHMRGQASELVHLPSMRSRGYLQSGERRAETKKIREELAQFRTIRSPPHERIQQGPDRISGMNHFKRFIIHKDTSDANISSEKAPSAFHGMDESTTPDRHQKRKPVNKNDEMRKRVLDFHDQLSEQSQLPENAPHDQEKLFKNDMDRVNNPQIEHQRPDSNGNPNLQYH